VQIVAGGALGAVSFTWQQQIDSSPGPTIPTEAIVPFGVDLPDPAFCSLSFGAGTYVQGDIYTVSSTGVVTGGSGTGVGLLAATRFDPRVVACARATSDAVTWMQPRCVPPIISVGQNVAGWLADLALFHLRTRQGMTPAGAGNGDDQKRADYETAVRELKAIGAAQMRPPDLVDSSPGNAGAGFTAMPISGPLVGWSC
jgi:hypothetical protein